MRIVRTREEAIEELGVSDALFEPVCEESLTAR
jgi:hypothetical protein